MQNSRPVIIRELLNEPDNIGIHFLPSQITQVGPAPVQQFFIGLIKKEEDQTQQMQNEEEVNDKLIAYLHGRKLNGKEIKLSEGKKLVVLKKEDGQHKIVREEDKVTYWVYGNDCKRNDKVNQMMNFPQLLEVFHSY